MAGIFQIPRLVARVGSIAAAGLKGESASDCICSCLGQICLCAGDGIGPGEDGGQGIVLARGEVGDCGHVGWDGDIRVGTGGRNIWSESGQVEKALDRVIVVRIVGGQRLEAVRYA